jgi:hypothetical protein
MEKRYELFGNGTEFMWWQEHNCERCVKAVWYNEKTDTFPKYRCAIQKEIELAAATDGCGSQRAFHAVHTIGGCPMLQTERKKPQKIDNEPKLFDL